MQAEPSAYPVTVELNAPLEVARWRPLVNFILAIPQLLVARALSSLAGILQLIALFTILFTKEIPRSMFDVIVMTMRYQWRVGSYALFMREGYPPFEFEPAVEDNGHDPAVLTVAYPGELRRFMPLVKWFLAIPHYIVLVFLAIGFIFSWLFSFFAVIFTGRFPEGLRTYEVGVKRWSTRVRAYVGLLRDEYPPFSLS